MKGLKLNLKPIVKHASEQQLDQSLSNSQDHLSHRSQQSIQQMPAPNDSVDNYNQQYSFNHVSGTERSARSHTPSENHIYRPESSQASNDTIRTNPQLLKKYSSIYDELKGIDHFEVIQLFLQEIEQNERNKQRIAETERSLSLLQEELSEAKQILEKKREAIRTLCQTESNNLNLIECLQKQISNKNFPLDSHYQQKYKQLENYMNEYICSTNEAQEEFRKNYKLVKSENIRLAVINQTQNESLLQKDKLLQIANSKNTKNDKLIAILKEKEATLLIKLQNIDEENATVKKELQSVLENMRAIDQFSIEVARENRDLSSELDIIRDKLNENSNISLDISDKIKDLTELNQKLLKQVDTLATQNQHANHQLHAMQSQIQKLDAMLQQTTREKAQALEEKEVLMEDYQQICKRLEMTTSRNNDLALIVQEREEEIDHLTQEIKSLNEYHEELIAEYQNEKQSKHAIKSQLMELAQQVRFMETTYKKEVVTNGKIKEELHKFWEKKDKSSRVLKQTVSNHSLEGETSKNNQLSRCQSMKQSNGSVGSAHHKWNECQNSINKTFS